MNQALNKRNLLELFCVAGIVSATGCYPAAPAATPPPSASAADVEHRRLIIKLKPGAIQCDADGIAKLSAESRVMIEFVRSVSGEACVIEQHAASPESLLQGQQLLTQQPAVESLEEDRKMKALTPK